MGIDSTFYVVYGVKVSYDSEIAVEALDILDNPEEIVIADYMCGNYMVLGKILARLNANEGGFSTIDIDDQTTLDRYAEEYIEKFEKLFGKEISQKYLQEPFKLIVFEHRCSNIFEHLS